MNKHSISTNNSKKNHHSTSGILKILNTFVLCSAMLLNTLPIAFADTISNNNASSALQERLNRSTSNLDLSEDDTTNEVDIIDENISVEEQAILDEINNNPYISVENETYETEKMQQNDENTISDAQDEFNDATAVKLNDEQLATLSASSEIPDKFKVDPVSSVYNVLNNNNDYVSEATGALTYTKNLISLEGRNGLDLNLDIQYNSSDAVLTNNEFESTNTAERKINFNNFAVGWSFGFTTIIKTQDKYGYSKRTQLRFADGSSYRIAHDSMHNNPSSDVTLTLENYQLSDMTLVRKADTKDYELTYSNGRVEIFDGTYGYIKKIKDNFNNEINFTWSEMDYYRGSFLDYIFTPSYYSSKIIALTSITDSMGRIINIDYDISTTMHGKEVKKLNVKMNNTTYAQIYLDRVESLNGTVDIVSKFIDAENYTTKYSYDEKISHIYNSYNEETYSVNGSIFSLTQVDLPTGGHIYYEYEKARRAYSYYVPEVTLVDWYEVYKISKVSDSSGFERTYEYENDYSGYPYSYLNVNPNDDNTYTSYNYTGYVYSSSFNYYCITRQNGKATISTFDYKHNKVKEQTYNTSNSQNEYYVNNGNTTWQALSGNKIFYLGYRNVSKNSNSSSNKLFLYSLNPDTGDKKILPALDENIPSSAQIKSAGNYIYIMYVTGNGTTSSPYKLVAKSYNTINETWNDAGELEIGTVKFSMNNMNYTNSKFYSWYRNGNTIYHAIYNPNASTNSRWTFNSCNISVSSSYSFVYVCQNNNKIYYNNRRNIYEYDLTNNTITSKSFSSLDNYSMSGGFTMGTRTFIYDYDYICEFDYSAGTTPIVYRFNSSQTMRPYLSNSSYLSTGAYTIQRAVDGNIYYLMKTTNTSGQRVSFRFSPDSDEKFVLAGSRLINNTTTNIFSSGNLSNPVIYFISDGLEKMKLKEPANTQSTTLTTYTYNSYNQLATKNHWRINGNAIQSSGSENYEYISGKSAISAYIDVLGNKTKYEYTSSTYYIPTKTIEYADTDNALETVNTLSADKTKILSTEITYSDRKTKKEFTYGDSAKPGNVTSECLYEMPLTSSEYQLLLQTDYGYDTSKTYIESTTIKNVQTNTTDFSLGTAQDFTSTSTHNELGLVTSSTDALGRTTYYGYNNNGWPTWTVYPDDSTIDIEYTLSGANGGSNKITTTTNDVYTVIAYYDDLGRQIKQSEKTANGSEKTLSTNQYSGHRLTKVTDAIGNYSIYNYDVFDRVTSLMQYDSNDVICGQYNIQFDDYNLIRTINNAGKTSKTLYDIFGRLIKEEQNTAAGLNTIGYTYDYRSNVVKTTDANNGNIINTYNDKNQLISTKNQLNQIETYEYDSFGNLIKRTKNGGNIYLHEYDKLGRLLKSTDAMELSEYFAYDKVGNMITYKDKKGQTTNYSYDNMNRLLNKHTSTLSVNYTYDNFGNVLSMNDSTGNTAYTYTDNNLLSGITTPDGETISYTYNNAKNIIGVVDYAGNSYSYTYDGLNRVDTIKKGSSTIADYDYTQFGTISKVTYPEGSTQYTYDNALRLISQVNKLSNSNIINQYSYTYDLIGNQTQKTDLSNGVEKITTYSYDAIGRLVSATEPDNTATSYTFDASNNIMTKNIVHPTDYEYTFTQNGTDYTINELSTHNFTYSYNMNNQLLQETEYVAGNSENFSGFFEAVSNYTYDANGNTVSKLVSGQIDENMVEYMYNDWNQLIQYKDTSGATTNYTYNGNGARTAKSNGGITTKYYWDRDHISNEAVGTAFTATNYIGMQGVFARASQDGTNYMFKNGHGDIVSLVSNGEIMQTYDYDAYGNSKDNNTGDTNPYRYCGEYLDNESGLIYLRNRYYAPELGRFMSMDTNWNPQNCIYGEEDGTMPDISAIMQSGNLYAYCMNNPIKYKDPTGKRSKKDADRVITDNSQFIINAAAEFGVNPGILAATIYAEQRLNVNWIDDATDGIGGFYGIDTSIGVAQVKVSTAKFLEEQGYMLSITAADGGWNIPIIGFVNGTETMARAKMLENPEISIRYAAAYCAYIQDIWKNSYPEISGRTAIVATVYNLGHEKTSPNANPKPNNFGTFARDNYYYVRRLMGI